MIGTIVKIKSNTPVVGIVIKQGEKILERQYWRVIGIDNHEWYTLSLDNPYIEVISESR